MSHRPRERGGEPPFDARPRLASAPQARRTSAASCIRTECDLRWQLDVQRDGRTGTGHVETRPPSTTDCKELADVCDDATGEIAHRVDSDDVVLVAATDSARLGFYLPAGAPPFAWLAALDGDSAPAALRSLPSADDALDIMLSGTANAPPEAWEALDGDRLTRHRDAVLSALRSGLPELPDALLGRAEAAFGDDAHIAIYDGAFRGASPDAYLGRVIEEPLPVLASRALEDLSQCGLDCSPRRFAGLAALSASLSLTDAVPRLELWLVAPDEEGKRPGATGELDEPRYGFAAWQAAAFALSQLRPAETCPRILEVFASRQSASASFDPPARTREPHLAFGTAEGIAADAVSLLYECDSPATRDAMAGIARDMARPRALRQLAVQWLVRVGAPEARELVGTDGPLDDAQRRHLPPELRAPEGSTAGAAPPPAHP